MTLEDRHRRVPVVMIDLLETELVKVRDPVAGPHVPSDRGFLAGERSFPDCLRDDDKRGVDRQLLRNIRVRIACKGVDSSQRLGRHRWVVERTLAWLARYRRLTIRYERRVDIHQAFLTLGCAPICFNHLPAPEEF